MALRRWLLVGRAGGGVAGNVWRAILRPTAVLDFLSASHVPEWTRLTGVASSGLFSGNFGFLNRNSQKPTNQPSLRMLLQNHYKQECFGCTNTS